MNFNKAPSRPMVLGVLALVALLWGLVLFFGPRAEPPPQTELPQVPIEELGKNKVSPQEATDRYAKITWGRNPFALPSGVVLRSEAAEETVSRETREPEPLPSVSAVLMSGAKKVAIVNGEVLGEGDRVAAWRIERITLERVIVHGPEGRRVLRVPQPRARVTSSPASE